MELIKKLHALKKELEFHNLPHEIGLIKVIDKMIAELRKDYEKITKRRLHE